MKTQLHAQPTGSGFRFADRLAEQAAAAGRKAERTQARIQAAACRLLEDRTANELKVAEICAEAGLAHGTFYLYFRDVRHLMVETLTAFVAFMQASMRGAARIGGRDRIRASNAAYVALFEENAGLMRCLVSRLDDFPEAAEAFQTLNRDWAATVVEARLRRFAREGQAAPPRDELMRRAYALGGMIDQYLIALFFGRDATLAEISRDRDAVVATLSLIWERGMEP